MPNIASVLKAEIARVARKELRAEVETLRKASTAYRSDIAALKRRVGSLEKELRKARAARPAPVAPRSVEADSPGSQKLRFSAKGLVSQRARLALSADDFGQLLGTSGQSIYNWEAGKARPRAKHLPAIAALRSLGKKEAREVLASLEKNS